MRTLTLPNGWEVIGRGVREFHGTTVLRAVYISNGFLYNVYTNGKPCGKGVPIEVVQYLLERWK